MVLQELEDRLYTSTEVANILGVSLRSVYRYLEDDKLTAEMKTATGRHRFTKQNILDFLSPQEKREPKAEVLSQPEEVQVAPAEPVVPVTTPEPAEQPAEASPQEEGSEDDVDWLAKFRAAAEKYKAEQEEVTEPETPEAPAEPVVPLQQGISLAADAEEAVEESQTVEVEVDSASHYYKSSVGGLKDIAQNIDKSAKKASLEYAFTMDAGLSLHKPIRPFSVIHAYVRSEDLAFFEKILDLQPVSESEAQLCLIVSDEADLYAGRTEIHGLNVVANDRLKVDLLAAGREDLAGEV